MHAIRRIVGESEVLLVGDADDEESKRAFAAIHHQVCVLCHLLLLLYAIESCKESENQSSGTTKFRSFGGWWVTGSRGRVEASCHPSQLSLDRRPAIQMSGKSV